MIGICANCGREGRVHKDHVVAKALGGSDDGVNIQCLCPNCHDDKTATDQSEIMRRYYTNPENRRKRSQAQKRALAAMTEEARASKSAKISRAKRAQYSNPDFRKKMSKAVAAGMTPEVCARISSGVKTAWQDPEKKARQREGVKKWWKMRRMVEDWT